MNLLSTLETYYDAAPRPTATTEDIGPFTLFLATDPNGWAYYARPRLDLDVPVTGADVEAVRDRQRAHDVPQSLEWVHENTPSLLEAARSGGMHVAECPLLVLATGPRAVDVTARVSPLLPDSAELPEVIGAIGSAFGDTDEFAPEDPASHARLMADDLLAMVGAHDEAGVVGGGSHSPRGDTTELQGIAVVPRARRRGIGAAITHALVADAHRRGIGTVFLSAQDDAVAGIYERVGFKRVGTACIAVGSDG